MGVGVRARVRVIVRARVRAWFGVGAGVRVRIRARARAWFGVGAMIGIRGRASVRVSDKSRDGARLELGSGLALGVFSGHAGVFNGHNPSRETVGDWFYLPCVSASFAVSASV